MLACQAVALFIRRRGGGAELAAPFLQIAEAFKCLEKGGTPGLFLKKTVAEKEREHSPERKHLQKLAAMALEVYFRLGDELNDAADTIARKVDKWPAMAAQKVTGNTVIAWREQLRMSQDEKFNDLVSTTLKETNPARHSREPFVEWPSRAISSVEIHPDIYRRGILSFLCNH